MKFFMLFILTTTFAIAQDCTYKLEEAKTKLEWTAFKTPLKVGVSGGFDKLGVPKNIKANSVSGMLENITFAIDSSTVNSGDKTRDGKLAKFFFEPLGKSISGKILSYKRKVLEVQVKINNQEIIIPMKVTTTKNQIHAQGAVDILDFEGQKALSSINKACDKLHEGKTWNDVGLKLRLNYQKSCK